MHELAHIKRRDLVWNWFPALAEVLFFFRPLVWLARREWRLAQEIATDELAVTILRMDVARYARSLVELVARCPTVTIDPHLAVTVSETYSQLSRRMIAMKTFRTLTPRRRLALAAVVLATGTCGVAPWKLTRQEAQARSELAAVPPLTAAEAKKPQGPYRQADQPAIDDLMEKFSNAASFWQQGEVARKLVALGDKRIILKMEKHLDTTDRRRRCNAGLVLAGLGDKRGLAVIIRELEDKEPRPTALRRSDGKPYLEGQIREDRYYAALLLGQLGKKEAVTALVKATMDETVNYRAAISLGEIGDKSAIPALHKMANDFPAQRLWAGYGLAALGERVGFDQLTKVVLSDPKWTDRRHAVEALGTIGDPRMVPIVVKALKDEHANVRVSAVRVLGKIGDQSAIPALTEALSDPDATEFNAPTTVKTEARKAIEAIKHKSK